MTQLVTKDLMTGVQYLVEKLNFSFHHQVQTGSGANPTSCPKGIGHSSPAGNKA
jgi:hypothetical protein